MSISRRNFIRRSVAGTLASLGAFLFSSGFAQRALSSFGRITLIEGSAGVATLEGGDFRALAQGRLVRPGQVVKTDPGSRVEITFLDKSVVRLGPESEYHIERVDYDQEVRRQFSAKLTRGRIWANVTPAKSAGFGGFQVRTPRAVISIRGTTYDLKSATNESAEVSVYEGRVGVAPPPIAENAGHEEFSWPEEVSEAEWEEIILGKLQRLRIGPDGKPGAPAAFSPEQERDPWAEWNLARDRA